MHFVGIKCEICSKLANAKDVIEDLPKNWLAVVPHISAFEFSNVRSKASHFCSVKHLYEWSAEQYAKAEKSEEFSNK